MLEKNDIVKLNISAISSEGVGIGKFTGGEFRDFVIYVPASAVGDEIECRIVKKLSKYAFGKIEKILTPSADRIENDCKAFPKCGGCEFRHVSYEAELRYKKSIVEYAYRSACKTENMPQISDCEGSPEKEFYRNKVQFPVSADGKCAFFCKNSHRTVDISDCRLQDKSFASVVRAFENWICENGVAPYIEESKKGILRHLYLRKGDGICVCVVSTEEFLPYEDKLAEAMKKIPDVKSLYVNLNREDTNVILGEKFRLVFGESYITDTMCGSKMQISPQSFYQVNKKQAEKIYTYGLSLAEIGKENKVLDLYCGIGSITLATAKFAGEAVGVEIVPEAIKDAKRIADENGVSNVRFYTSDANRLKKVLRDANFVPDTVIVDPPRKGLDDETVNALVELSPEKIVYISCNPQTQARNVRDICEKSGGKYNVGTVKPFDMFPRTKHVETVVLLSRTKNQRNRE